jgi:DNA-binding NtrC family response regulator
LAAATRENHALIYGDKKTESVLKIAKQIAPSEANILLTGASGTGKEIFSRFIHDNSKRANKKFVAVNCAAIPETLLESELFGYEKGAFTGAVARRIGKFEEASDGTLLLDEISEMDIKIQAKLLRAIQEKEIDRIGGKTPIKVNTRIIATSNRHLDEEVKKGTFRQDLYYRLNVVNINIPSLCDRMDDVIVLAKHFAKKYSELNDIPLKPISKSAEDKLLNYRWPGNVRELENTIHRAVLLSTGEEIGEDAIILDDLSAIIDNEKQQDVLTGGEFTGNTLASMERNLIIDTLKHTMGNRTMAANILGISIRTLRNKLKQYQDEGMDI